MHTIAMDALLTLQCSHVLLLGLARLDSARQAQRCEGRTRGKFGVLRVWKHAACELEVRPVNSFIIAWRSPVPLFIPRIGLRIRPEERAKVPFDHLNFSLEIYGIPADRCGLALWRRASTNPKNVSTSPVVG
jgi:hypothetical protein